MRTKSLRMDSLEDLQISIYQVNFINKLDFRKAPLCIPPSNCNKLYVYDGLERKYFTKTNSGFCVFYVALRTCPVLLRLLGPIWRVWISLFSIYMHHILMPTWSSETSFHIIRTALHNCALLQAIPSIKNFNQVVCETERRGKRNEGAVAKFCV